MVYNRGGRVSGGSIIPTAAQLWQCFVLCSWATKMYLPVNLVRIDERTGNVFILIGEEMEIEIDPNGEWIE
ncbi:DUF6888 family protein [Kamptonema formosum]|uniref:DUF6888 family protein n=1 Tax=Kamptonema formosum TaxID=331992 RepID=UPI0008FC1613